jgi:hypothetical protein
MKDRGQSLFGIGRRAWYSVLSTPYSFESVVTALARKLVACQRVEETHDHEQGEHGGQEKPA